MTRTASWARANEPAVLLWDFGNTLADERWAWPGPPGVVGWEAAYRAFGASELADRWNAGLAATTEVAAVFAAGLDCSPETANRYLHACCRSISFFPTAWRAARQHAVTQALVTTNPDLFRSEIVATYCLDRSFDVIVISADEQTTDKTELCEIALRRLDPTLRPASSVLIDNLAHNVHGWKQRGGHGYVVVDDATFARDLAAGGVPGIGPATMGRRS
jgi:FMN phosphatase YigB (HAD superfamily)